MAETREVGGEAATTRKRTPAKAAATATRKAPVKAAAASDAVAFALTPDGSTRTYAKFKAPEGSGCVGTFYAPLGTKVVKVRLEK
jgi:hypothetical protein